MNYSVLMSVYWKEKPEHFRCSVQSILDQTIKTDDFVIVCDGPLTEELEIEINKFVLENPNVFNIIRLPENVGIGLAAKTGLQHCKNELVAKMDSDDIAIPERCEKQIKKFLLQDELVIVGGYISEFDENPAITKSLRKVPLKNHEIRSFAKKRQPFNNVTVMYKKSKVLSVGSYRDLKRGEDFDLYIRMLNEGFYAENIPEVLVHVRVNPNAINRRSSWDTFRGVAVTRWESYKIGFSTFYDFMYCLLGSLVITLVPNKMQNFIYKIFLRE